MQRAAYLRCRTCCRHSHFAFVLMMFQDKCFRSNSDAARFANDLFRRLATCFANPYCMLPREDRFPVTHHGYPPIKLDVQHGQFPLANLGIDVNETPPRDRRRNERTIGVWMETSREGLIAGRNQMFFGSGEKTSVGYFRRRPIVIREVIVDAL